VFLIAATPERKGMAQGTYFRLRGFREKNNFPMVSRVFREFSPTKVKLRFQKNTLNKSLKTKLKQF
jgi:hypothetical protein